jgi:amino acid transporter
MEVKGSSPVSSRPESMQGKEKSDGVQDVLREPGSTTPAEGSVVSAELQRHMSSRHLQFIAIGGTIGTGIFLGTGSALAKAGPVSCLISYVFVGSILYSVMVSLGEMATFIPTAGSFAAYAGRFVDPALGFATGWLYWFSCMCPLSWCWRSRLQVDTMF